MSEEQTQQLLYQLQMLEAHFADLTQRENTLGNVYREASLAIETVKNIDGQNELDTLVPVGMGTYIKAKSTQNDKIILNVGAGVAIEKPKDAAINYLEARLKEVEVALQEVSTKRHDIAMKLEAGKQEMNHMMRQAQAKPKQ